VVENAGVENTGAKTYGKPPIQKSLTVEARIRMCLIVNGRQLPISGKPNRTVCMAWFLESTHRRHSELSEIMSHVYLFSHVYVFLYLLNYITSLY